MEIVLLCMTSIDYVNGQKSSKEERRMSEKVIGEQAGKSG
jgi:hypothetical protein